MMVLLVIQAALAGDGGLTVLPLGVGLYVHHEPGRGALYTATQAIGIGFATWSTVDALNESNSDAPDSARIDRDELISAVSVGTAALSYVVSIVDGSRLHEEQCVEVASFRSGLDLWDRGRALSLRTPNE